MLNSQISQFLPKGKSEVCINALIHDLFYSNNEHRDIYGRLPTQTNRLKNK